MTEKTGKFYKIELHFINKVKYWFVCSINGDGYLIVSRSYVNALSAFETAEKVGEDREWL